MSATITPPTAHPYRWFIFTILACGYMLVYFHRLCPAVLAVDLMHDLKAGGGLTGLLAAAYFYPYAVMQLPAGLLSDSWGPRNTITCFFIVAFVGSLILGIAPTATWAIIGRSIVGMGVAMLFVPTLKILAEWFRPREFGRMTGLLMGVGGLGSLTAASPLVWLNTLVGWRNAFLLVGGFTLLLAILVRLWVYDRPAQKMGAAAVKSPAATGESVSLLQGVRTVLLCRHFWPLAIWFFFDFAVFFSFGGLWGGPFLIQVYGMDKVAAGRVLSMLAVGLVGGAPLMTWLADRVFRRNKPVLVLCGVVMLFLNALLIWRTATLPLWGLYVIFTLYAACANGIGAVAFTMNKELFPVSISGTASGLVNLFPFAAAAIFQPAIGLVLESFGKTATGFSLAGYKTVFVIYFGTMVVALAAALFTHETRVPSKPG